MRVEASQEAMQVALDDLFASARKECRPLTSAEVMQSIGLKRTSINVTYPHINERRKAHNRAIALQESATPTRRASVEEQVRKLQETVSELRSALRGETERSEQYAQVIRELALQNHELRLLHPNYTDARGRFRSIDAGVEE